MLPGHRVLLQGQSPHPWEQQAVAFIRSALPDTDPYLLWAMVDYQEPSGRIAQIDAIVLGFHALYLVEIKSWPGTVTGNSLDWVNVRPDGTRLLKSNPYHRAAEVARILAGGLDRVWPRDAKASRPYVEPIVFLAHEEVKVELPDAVRANLVTRATFARAITHGEIPISGERVRAHAERHPINKPCRNATIDALRKLGLHESKAVLKLGDLQLKRAIEEGEGYQDWEATHETIGVRRRVRLWLVPQSPTAERRDQLARAARTEAEALSVLSEHRGVLHFSDYRAEGPTGGPAIVFDEQQEMEPLEAFIRRRGAALPFEHRVSILEQIASALGYCHRKGVIHRNLHPGSVLVRERPGGPPETRLYNFQLATQADGTTGTIHLSAYAPDRAGLYRAPEVFENPSLARTVEADLFSLGALAYFVLTGRHPGTTLPERGKLLGKDGLSLAAAADGLAGEDAAALTQARSVEEVVRAATHPNPFERHYDTVDAWAADLLTAATEPDRPAVPVVDPLEAKPGDIVDGDLLVEGPLGEGSTARVLKVDRAGQSYALKVALPGADERVAAEGEAIERARGERIVRLEQKRTIAGRTCLLLGLAGETLGDYLAKHGPPSLDYSRRWGEDLLAGLVHLEEQGVLHRDVKPANCGLTPADAKKARRLFLFDLSLAAVPRDAVAVGTPAYRDPFLPERGRWDEAADRWSAAVTLHELLTGSRPRFGSGDAPAVATEEEAAVASDLFDPSVRGRLTTFLRRALARDAGKRFPNAEEMRTEWVAAFSSAAEAGLAAPAELTDAQLAALPADGSIDLLPLGAPARNALDRCGIRTVRDLVSIPRNQLRIRGVGRETAQEILALAERLRGVRPPADAAALVPFFPGYRGRDGRIDSILGLVPGAADALEAADLSRVHALAAAGAERITRILEPFKGAADHLKGWLVAEHKAATDSPVTIEGFLEVLLPSPRTARGDAPKRHVRALLGLDRLEGVTPGDAAAAAAKLDVSRQALYLSLGKLRTHWKEQQATQVRAAAAGALSVLRSAGGAAPLESLAVALPSAIPHEPGQGEGEDAVVRAKALLRIVAEAAPLLDPEPLPLALGRIAGAPWLAESQGHLDAVHDVGSVASALAHRDPLPSSDEVRQEIVQAASSTPIAGLPADRLLALAADASPDAALSARLEIYPRAMPPERALRLSSGALPADVAPAEVKRTVAARYRDARPLPDRPALDALMLEAGYGFDAARERYVRKGLAAAPDGTLALSTRRSTIHVQRALIDPNAVDAELFDQGLRDAVQTKAFRVLDVDQPWAEAAAAELSHRLKVAARSLDRDLLSKADDVMREMKIAKTAVLAADRGGPSGRGWRNIVELMKVASSRLADSLLAESEPVVLTHPGILARYGLEGFLTKLVTAADEDRAPPIFLLNPVWQELGGPPPIDDVERTLPIPAGRASRRVTVPAAWIQNKDRGGVA